VRETKERHERAQRESRDRQERAERQRKEQTAVHRPAPADSRHANASAGGGKRDHGERRNSRERGERK
jgi:hypothetical protein